MDRFFASLSRNVLALLVIGGGIILMILFNPPHTVCDTDLDFLKQGQKNFIFKDPKDKLQRQTQFETAHAKCLETNTPGGCYELFRKLKQLKRDLDEISRDCRPQAG